MGFLLFIYLIVAAYGSLELITGQPHQPVSLIKIWRLVESYYDSASDFCLFSLEKTGVG
jgi:hypothetical protein